MESSRDTFPAFTPRQSVEGNAVDPEMRTAERECIQHRLQDDAAGHELPQLDARHREDGDHGVAERVAKEHPRP